MESAEKRAHAFINRSTWTCVYRLLICFICRWTTSNWKQIVPPIFFWTNSGKFLVKNRIFFKWPPFYEILIFFEIFLFHWLTNDLNFKKKIWIFCFRRPYEELEISQIDLSNLNMLEIRPYKSKYYWCIRLKEICFILEEYLNKPQNFWKDSLFFPSPKIPKNTLILRLLHGIPPLRLLLLIGAFIKKDS